MSPELVLCTLTTIILHSVGSVNHTLCLPENTGGGGEGGPGPGGSAREIITSRSSSIGSCGISYVNSYQTYLVHKCTTRATQQPKVPTNETCFSLATIQQQQQRHQPPSTSCPCLPLGFFSSFSSLFFSDSNDQQHHQQKLVKGKRQPERDSSSSPSHLTANNTYHLQARPCAPTTTVSQLQNRRRRRRRNISISQIRNIRSRSMLQQYGSTEGSTSTFLALSPLHHPHHQTEHHWSPANVELFQAVAKVTILVLLKLLIKYYVRGYFKAHITSKALFELLDLTSKALTIAIAKCAIKWALYPALRTAAKTLLIASLRSLLKPITTPLIKGVKKGQGAISEKQQQPLGSSSLKFALTLAVKVIIKTTALEMLVLVFENEATQLPLHQLMVRVTLILVVKMCAKRVCKLGKQKVMEQKELSSKTVSSIAADDVKGNNTAGDTSAPVDKMLMFAIQKLVTKLVKIPLIKMLL